MGLLDKVESNETKPTKKAPAKAAKAVKVAEAVPVEAKPAKTKKEKKPKVKKARPESLSSEFEISPKLSRVISWWVNFIANFAVLIAALVMSALTGGSSGGLETTILFLVAIVVLFFNAIFLPIYTGRNLGQYTLQLDTFEVMAPNLCSCIACLLTTLVFSRSSVSSWSSSKPEKFLVEEHRQLL